MTADLSPTNHFLARPSAVGLQYTISLDIIWTLPIDLRNVVQAEGSKVTCWSAAKIRGCPPVSLLDFVKLLLTRVQNTVGQTFWACILSVRNGKGCPIHAANSVWSLYGSPVLGWTSTLCPFTVKQSRNSVWVNSRARAAIHDQPRKKCAHLVRINDVHFEHRGQVRP